MKPFWSRGRRSKRTVDELADRELLVDESVQEEFTNEELREFLDADDAEISADPVFKELLRRKLWEIVRSSSSASASDDPNDHGNVVGGKARRPRSGRRRDRSV